MALFLLILKIIGLILLGILGIFVFLLLVVLFVPVRYRVRACYDDEFNAKVNVSYLLHFLSVTIIYDKVLNYKIRVLGIPLRLKKNNQSDLDSPKLDNKENTKVQEDDGKTTDQKSQGKFSTEKLTSAIDVLTNDNTRRAYEVCKKRLSRLFKAILPYKCNIEITYGLDNPAITGMIMGLYNVFLIYLNQNIKLFPIYDEKRIYFKGDIKGKIVAINVFWQGLCVLFNKDCRKFYKTVRSK